MPYPLQKPNNKSRDILLQPVDYEFENVSKTTLRNSRVLEVLHSKEKRQAPQPVTDLNERLSEHGLSVFLVLATVPFFVYGGLAADSDGLTVDEDNWTNFQRARDILVTAYPIVFAVVVGRNLRKIAAWRLERGVKLITLEQLAGSSSVGSALATHWLLRGFNFLGLLLVLAWAASPSGGQALLHILSVDVEPVQSPIALQYFSTDQSTPYRAQEPQPQAADVLFKSAMLTSAAVRNSGVDVWGNVKILDFNRLGNTSTDSGPWKDVQESSMVKYSSLIGIPLAGLPDVGNTSFVLESSYFGVNCLNVSYGTWVNATQNETIGSNESPTTYYIASELYGRDGRYYDHTVQDTFSISSNNLTAAKTGIPHSQMLLFQSISNTSTKTPKYTKAYCTLSHERISSSVLCTSRSCAVKSMRPTTLAPNTNNTGISNIQTFQGFTSALHNQAMAFTSFDFSMSSGMSPIEYYVSSPDFLIDNSTTELWRNLSVVAPEDFGLRLQQILNTMWHGSMDPGRLFGNKIVGNVYETDRFYQGFGATRTTTGTTTVSKMVYRCDFRWLTLYMIATTVMFGVGLAGGIVNLLVRGPDILGYSSSLTRDSTYVKSVVGGTAQGGAERARRFADMRLRMVDVLPEEEFGHLAVVDEEYRADPAAVMKHRLYR